MGFALISEARGDRCVQLLCDGTTHAQVTLPMHQYSGEATGIELTGCDCKKTESTREGEADSNGGETQPT